jgi:hypothetical protein
MSDSKTTTTFWSTKYALTKGVTREDGCHLWTTSGTTYVIRGNSGNPDYLFLQLDRYAFATEKAAMEDAMKQAERKLKSLDKERAKIEARASSFHAAWRKA